jgi:putative Ca2+/H+ antiporter (TMEM165/GDT1 family)
VVLFLFFGLRSLYHAILAWDGGGGESELAEVEAELGSNLGGGDDKMKKAGGQKGKGWRKVMTAGGLVSPVFLETFIITFLAEWGDRSQIATIGLAASMDPYGVTLGGIAGHAVCTGAAVLGGRHMATRISERAVALCGGVLFVLFGVHALVSGVDE